MRTQDAAIPVHQTEVSERPIGLAAFLFWSVGPLLAALMLLTWSRVETQRLQYQVSVMSRDQQDWAAREKRAQAQWQAISSRESLRRGAQMLNLKQASSSQRWSNVP